MKDWRPYVNCGYLPKCCVKVLLILQYVLMLYLNDVIFSEPKQVNLKFLLIVEFEFNIL